MENLLYIIIAVAQIAILIIYFTRSKKKKKPELKPAHTEDYPFDAMRKMALNAAPGILLASIPEDTRTVYAVVMDWNVGSDMITLSTNLTGEANLYVKSGGGVVGAGKYANIAAEAQALVNIAQQLVATALYRQEIHLPAPDNVQFCLLTNHGKFIITDSLSKIKEQTSLCLPLFEKASHVINEMRATAADN